MAWKTAGELVEEGFCAARVVMLNEGHAGLARCPRTRRVGREVLGVAHQGGCRYLALEALPGGSSGPSFRRDPGERFGYLAQPEMIQLVDAALDLGWLLVGYECHASLAPDWVRRDMRSLEATNWREQQQAENLVAALAAIELDERMLVWCGNSHHMKVAPGAWIPMGWHFAARSTSAAFAIDQLATVSLAPGHTPRYPLSFELATTLETHGGTAGFTAANPPEGFLVPSGYDALLLSTDNEMLEDT